MTTDPSTKDVNEDILTGLLDRLIPAIDDVPAAGQMGLAAEVVRLATGQDRSWGLFRGAMESFASQNPSFADMDGDTQDQAIRSFDTDWPEQFVVLRDICYIVYYKNPAVHRRIGWESRPPQPDGNEMVPWDESVLENIRKRQPFWRRV